jgi:chromosome segregation ATPase
VEIAMEKRNEYIKKLEDGLNAYNAKITEMKVKVAETRSDVKAEYQSQVESVEKKRDDFVVKYDKLKDSSGHAWEDMKSGTEKAWSDLEDSVKKAGARFK